ncbi:unnamed protein product [Diamesa hyperborea]
MITLYLLIGVLLALYVYMTWNFGYWTKRGVTQAKTRLVLGSLPSLILRKEHTTYDLDKIYKEFKGKLPFVGLIQIRSPRLLILDPKLSKTVMISNFKSFHDNEFAQMIDPKKDPLLSRSPFLLTGEEWKEKRAEITPAFTNNRLKALYPLIQDVQSRLSKFINNELSKNSEESFDSREVSAKFTTDVVSSCIYGADAESFTKEDPEIRAFGRKLTAPTGAFIFLMFITSAIPILKKVTNLRFVSQEVQDFFVNLLKQAITYRNENNVKREDFLGYLIELKNKKNITELDMAAHTISFFSDGFETSSLAICHTLYELGKNKKVQDKLRQEITKCVDKNGQFDFETLNDMAYLDQVFHESLRMHSPALFTSRLCTEQFLLEADDGQKVLIEKGLNVLVPINQFHFDPEYYTDPHTFYPERFDAENGGLKAFRDRGVYLVFGDGPRMCLGMKFATLQSKAAIAEIVNNFEISVNAKTPEKLIADPKEFMNISIGGLWLDFKPIKK